MSKNQKRNIKIPKKKSNKAKPVIQPTTSVAPVQVIDPSKRSFHLNWSKVNFVHFTIFLFLPLLLTIIVIFPILNSLHYIFPDVSIISETIVTFITFLLTAVSAGFLAIKKIDLFHPKKYSPNQTLYAIVSGSLLSLLLLIPSIEWPAASIVLSPIPFPPYKGVLMLDGMQSGSSSKYFWQQGASGQRSCKFVSSAYHVITTKQDRLEFCDAVNTNFHNFAFEIDMSFIKPGSAIIFFRANKQVSYQLDIDTVENYANLSLNTFSFSTSQKLSDVELIQPMPIVDQSQGPIMFAPGYTNHIGIVSDNDTFTIYINGKTTNAWQVSDDSSSQGSIGVGAFTPSSQDNPQTEIEFSNAKVWQLE